MNIEDIRPGMQVRVKTFDELNAEGKIAHNRRSFVRQAPFGWLEYRIPYLGGIFCVEEVSGSNVYLGSCNYKELSNDLVWWHPDLLTPVEGSTELEEIDETELSLFLDEFVQK